MVGSLHRNHLAVKYQFLQIKLLRFSCCSYYVIVTQDCVFVSVRVLGFSVLLVAMVLSPHAVPVVSSLWIRVWRDAEPQRARFRFLGRWSPPNRRVRSFIGRAGRAATAAASLSQPGHRKTPEARTTATVAAAAAVAATEVTAAASTEELPHLRFCV